MPTVKTRARITVEEYLEGEHTSDVKHELIDGYVYAMAGASKNHERITQNISRKFGNHLENSPCEPFGSDTKVRVRDNFFYPDVLVDCNVDESKPYYTDTPVIVVEVISSSTRHRDKGEKLLSYINLPSLEEYVLIEQDFVSIDVLRKNEGWIPRNYILGESIRFESIDLTLSVEEIYHRVQNDDMVAFINMKKGEEAEQ